MSLIESSLYSRHLRRQGCYGKAKAVTQTVTGRPITCLRDILTSMTAWWRSLDLAAVSHSTLKLGNDMATATTNVEIVDISISEMALTENL